MKLGATAELSIYMKVAAALELGREKFCFLPWLDAFAHSAGQLVFGADLARFWRFLMSYYLVRWVGWLYKNSVWYQNQRL